MDLLSELPFSTQSSDPRMLAPSQQTPLSRAGPLVSLASISSSSVVFDLGCGDGSLLGEVRARTGCKAVGYEIDGDQAEAARERFRGDGDVEVRERDFMGEGELEGLGGAHVVVFVFLQFWSIYLLEERLEEVMRRGGVVVSYMWHFETFAKRKDIRVETDEGKTLFVYKRIETGKD